jgi:hypothetical protein
MRISPHVMITFITAEKLKKIFLWNWTADKA